MPFPHQYCWTGGVLPGRAARMINWQRLHVTRSTAFIDQLVIFCPQAGLLTFSQCSLRRGSVEELFGFIKGFRRQYLHLLQ